jgi:hypothetical protein
MLRGRIALTLHRLGAAIARISGGRRYADRLDAKAVRVVGAALHFGRQR